MKSRPFGCRIPAPARLGHDRNEGSRHHAAVHQPPPAARRSRPFARPGSAGFTRRCLPRRPRLKPNVKNGRSGETLGHPGGKLWVELEGTWICLRPENWPSDTHTHTWCYAEVEYSTRIDQSRGQLTKTVYPVQRGNPMVVAHTGTIDACWEPCKQWFPALCQVAMRWSCATPKHGNGDTYIEMLMCVISLQKRSASWSDGKESLALWRNATTPKSATYFWRCVTTKIYSSLR